MTWNSCSAGRFRRARKTLAWLTVGGVLLARSLAAQDVSGVVRDVVTGAPLPGAVVALLDSTRAPVQRVIASTTGAFRLAGARAVTLRVVRIGYRPWEAPLARLGASPVVVEMTPLGNQLRPVVVSTSPVCPERSDTRQALALWSSAQDGLLALTVAAAAGADTGSVRQILFDRLLDDAGRRIVRQSWYRVTTGNAAPIRADRDPVEFVGTGYVEKTATGMTYYAPDPLVLLDSTFAETHCLALRTDRRAHPEEMGVSFSPIAGRDSIPDIAGVLWLSRAPLALRSLEFEYVGIDSIIRSTRAGGRLEFQTLSNGVPIIAQWHVRSPRLMYLPAGTVRRARTEVTGHVPSVADLRESGGLIASGTFADGTTWSAPLASLAGRVVNAATTGTVPNARVFLDSTDAQTFTNDDGQFSFHGLLPGPYVVRVVDTVAVPRVSGADSLADTAHSPTVVARERAVNVEARLDRVANVEIRLLWRDLVNSCRGEVTGRRWFVVVGTVVGPDSVALSAASVRLGWTDIADSVATETVIDARADVLGRFVACGVPGGVPIAARVVSASGDQYTGSAVVPLEMTDDRGRPHTGSTRRMTFVVARNRER